MKRVLILVAVAAAASMFSSSALANSLTCGHGVTCQSGTLGASHTSGNGTLPFTGLDLAGVAAAAAVLLAAGLTLHRVGRRRS